MTPLKFKFVQGQKIAFINLNPISVIIIQNKDMFIRQSKIASMYLDAILSLVWGN